MNKQLFYQMLGSSFLQVNKKLLTTIGLAPAILFSLLAERMKYHEANNQLTEIDGEGDWFWLTSAQIEEKIGMTETVRRTATQTLIEMGLIQNVRKGMPKINYYRINTDVFYGIITQGNLDDNWGDPLTPIGTTEARDNDHYVRQMASHKSEKMTYDGRKNDGYNNIYKNLNNNINNNIGVQNEILHPLQQYERELKIKIPNHLTYEEAEKLENEFGFIAVKETLESLANYKKQTQYKSVYLTLRKWINKDKANKPSYMNNPLPDLRGLVIE